MRYLLPGVKIETALELLTGADIAVANVPGQSSDASDVLRRYREWAVNHARLLGSAFYPSAIDQVVTTPRHWVLQTVSPENYGAGLWPFVQFEIEQARASISKLHAALSQRRELWVTLAASGDRAESAHAVVLDTNVLLQHCEGLAELDWSATYFGGVRVPVVLGIPAVVIEELDNLKRSRDDMEINGEKRPRRTVARAALRLLDTIFVAGELSATLQREEYGGRGLVRELKAVLMVDELEHTPLPTVDAEIIDRTLDASAYVAGIAIASYDHALSFRARAMGLRAGAPLVTDEDP